MNRSYLDKAYDIYFQSVSKNAESKVELAKWSAWGNGAVVIDGGLSAIPGFDLTPDSLDKAKCLVNLLIQPMISMWYYNWEKQEPHSAEEMLEARKIAFANVQTFLGMRSSDTLSINLILDIELTYFQNDLRNSSAFYIGMFHQRYRECLEGEQIVEWDKLKIPIEDWENFLGCCGKNRYKNLDLISSVAAFALICDAGAHMFQEFKQTYHKE